MIQIKNITKLFGDHVVLNNLSCTLGNEVVGLLGANGSGKTTLFSILAGETEPDAGHIALGNERIGYLPQGGIAQSEQTVYDVLFATTDPSAMHSVLNTLRKVGLEELDFTQPVGTLSGGQRTKLGLATLLIQQPEPTLLLLDEPTNNLDVSGMIWLTEMVNSFHGGIFITSHDRSFLDATVDRILYLEDGHLKEYGGNYSFVRREREKEKAILIKNYTTQEKHIAKIEEDIQRIRSQTLQGEEQFSSRNPYQRRKIRKAAQQGVARKKKLEKFLASEEHLDKPKAIHTYPFQFFGQTHKAKFMLGFDHLSKVYAEKKVISDLSFSVFGQERIHLQGVNGSGKSTVLRILAEKEQPTSGQCTIGTNISVGYFSQEGLVTTSTKSPLDIIRNEGVSETQAHEYAAFMHLSAIDITKPLAALSRGQITKVAFILLLMKNHQVLLLDEPTNHLEIDTREEIEVALKKYDGTLIIASHDRYFLEEVGITKSIELTTKPSLR